MLGLSWWKQRQGASRERAVQVNTDVPLPDSSWGWGVWAGRKEETPGMRGASDNDILGWVPGNRHCPAQGHSHDPAQSRWQSQGHTVLITPRPCPPQTLPPTSLGPQSCYSFTVNCSPAHTHLHKVHVAGLPWMPPHLSASWGHT